MKFKNDYKTLSVLQDVMKDAVKSGFVVPFDLDSLPALLVSAHLVADGQLVTKSTVRSRGWTQKMIDEYLGEPDLLAPNPHGSGYSPMQLFLLSRVEIKEKDPVVNYRVQSRLSKWEAKGKMPDRIMSTNSSSTITAVKTADKREFSQGFLKKLEVWVPILSISQLLKKAIRHNNRAINDSSPLWFVTIKDSPSSLEKICSNYLMVYGEASVGWEVEEYIASRATREEKEAFRTRIEKAISDQYPNLAEKIAKHQINLKGKEDRDRLACVNNPAFVYNLLVMKLGHLIADSYVTEETKVQDFLSDLREFVQVANEMFGWAGIENFISVPPSKLNIDIVCKAFSGLHPIDGMEYPSDDEDHGEGYTNDDDED